MISMASSRQQTRLTVFVATLSLVVLMSPGMSPAQTTDITPSGLNTQVNLSALQHPGEVQYDITGGTRPGGGPNLFHSFGEFSIGTDNIANFLNETALPTSNILSRVTGGNPSNIFGTLQTTNFGAANLYLINPAGIIFGPTAELNVSGSFAASTADYLKMTDGATFSANPAQPTVLSIAPVAAFGFLRADVGFESEPKGITLKGGSNPLSVDTGQSISLVGGANTFAGLSGFEGETGAQLSAPGGQITIASVGSHVDQDGEIFINAPGSPPSVTPTGFGDNLIDDNFFRPVQYLTLSEGQQTSIAVDQNSNLVIRGGQLVVNTHLFPASFTVVTPKTGTVTIASGSLVGSFFTNAPPINIETGTLVVDGALSSERRSSSIPHSITLTAAKSITVTGLIGSDLDFATGGQITLTSPSVTVADNGAIRAEGGRGGSTEPGTIMLNIETLNMIEGGTITSSSIGSACKICTDEAPAGAISIQGLGGPGTSATSVNIEGASSGILSKTNTSANAGSILVHSQNISLSNHAIISSSTSGNGPAGNITLVTQSVNLSSDSSITSNAVASVLLTNPFDPDSPTMVSTGMAGSITITGAGSAPTTIAGGTIQAQSETIGIAGDITLHAPGDLTLLGTTVSVKNTGAGSAGLINLRAGDNLLVRNSQVSTESAEASGGNIKLTAPNLIRLVDGRLESSVKGPAESNGGNINIDPQLVVIQNSRVLANANAGAGGNITIAASGAVLVDPNSVLTATAGPAGVSGTVNISAPIQVLSGALVPLNLVYSQPGLSGDRCAADPTGQFSSFVQTGRDGVPQVPGALSPSPLSFLETLTSGSWGLPKPNWAGARLGLDSMSVNDSTLFHSACRS